MVSALELREPVVFPLCSGYSEVCHRPFIISMNSWSFLICFRAWDLKCRTQLDILSRIYQVGFIEGMGRWVFPVSPNSRCCYTSQATEQWEKFKFPSSPWCSLIWGNWREKELAQNFLCLCWGQQWKKSIAPAGSLSPPWYGRRARAECPGGLLKCRLQVLLQGMWFPRGVWEPAFSF